MDTALLIETLQYFALIMTRSSIKYAVICGGAFGLFWVLLPEALRHRRIQARLPSRERLISELARSVLGLAAVGATTALALPFYEAGYLKVYMDASEHSLLWLPASFLLLIVAGDTYFYWAHRAMHARPLYRWTHALHHRSTKPSPLAAYSINAIEGAVHGMFLPLMLLVVPLHTGVMAAMMMFYISMLTYVHLGYELLPRSWASGPVTRWLGSSVMHNMHHQHFRCNYGVYFTWWDYAMGTMHPDYIARFEQVTAEPLIRRRTSARRRIFGL